MELVTYTEADIALTEAIETDPAMMAELGGPVPAESIPAVHSRRVGGIANGDWWLKIVPEPGGPAAGTIGIWPREWEGEEIFEAGWMVLPAFQGRGIAGQALALLIERARTEPRFRSLHAFPGVTNQASNALCRRAGFELIAESQGEYAGRPFRVNHWRLEL
jgi:RimJ/RimL family protein N-acetyltransferase